MMLTPLQWIASDRHHHGTATLQQVEAFCRGVDQKMFLLGGEPRRGKSVVAGWRVQYELYRMHEGYHYGLEHYSERAHQGLSVLWSCMTKGAAETAIRHHVAEMMQDVPYWLTAADATVRQRLIERVRSVQFREDSGARGKTYVLSVQEEAAASFGSVAGHAMSQLIIFAAPGSILTDFPVQRRAT